MQQLSSVQWITSLRIIIGILKQKKSSATTKKTSTGKYFFLMKWPHHDLDTQEPMSGRTFFFVFFCSCTFLFSFVAFLRRNSFFGYLGADRSRLLSLLSDSQSSRQTKIKNRNIFVVFFYLRSCSQVHLLHKKYFL